MMAKKNLNRLSSALILVLLALCAGAAAQPARQTAQGRAAQNRAPQNRAPQSRAPQSRAAAQPRLVLVIMVDQFRYDFLERFADLFVKDGFMRLMTEGALFTNANFSYIPTYTAPGHAAVFTGSIPAKNGIVGNAWFDRETGRTRVMVSDPQARAVSMNGAGADAGSFSPRNLIGTTIGDQMRLSNNFQSKVVAVSFKDRSAILPGGKRPNGAFWFNAASGTFVSSDYYFKELPAWVKKFNSEVRPDRYFGAKWTLALSEDAYSRSQPENLANQRSSLGANLPYTLTGGEEKPGARFYNAFELTPFASEYLAEFAKAALEGEALGQDRWPDLLSVSFSSPDLAGHSYGPDSREVEDTFIRLDRVIADLLDYVDKRVGLANTVIAVTGDHGVAPVPERMQALGFDAGRISGRNILDAVNKALAARFGEGKWVLGFVNDQIYLDHKLVADKNADPAEVERVAGEAALTVPGIIDYFTRSEIIRGSLPDTDVSRRVVNGFHRQRSGDVWIITKPYAFVTEGNLATTHGSPYNYDTHVPVIVYGAGVRAGRYHVACSPSDIAPTIAALIGVEPPPHRVGRVLHEAISK